MDPNAALGGLIHLALNGAREQHAEARDLALALSGWLESGGFLPERRLLAIGYRIRGMAHGDGPHAPLTPKLPARETGPAVAMLAVDLAGIVLDPQLTPGCHGLGDEQARAVLRRAVDPRLAPRAPQTRDVVAAVHNAVATEGFEFARLTWACDRGLAWCDAVLEHCVMHPRAERRWHETRRELRALLYFTQLQSAS